MEEWAESINLLPDSQTGFRKGYRTESNLFILHTIMQRAAKESRDLHIAFIDLSKAFDSVSRPLLWSKLRAKGARGPIFDLIRVLYESIVSVVKVGDEFSALFKGEMGVLQGCPLSGLLWTLFLHDFSITSNDSCTPVLGKRERGETIHRVPKLEMADDIAALALGPPKKKGGKRNSTAANAVMQKRLMEIGHWCSRNLLSISIAKTVWMVIYFSKLSEEESAEAAELSLSLHGKPLAEAPSAKYIGLLYTKFDTTRYRHHMTKLAGSLRGHSNTLINVQGQHGALSPRDSRDFYVEQARSLVLFSAPITFAADGKMLESAEHDYMRAILRLGAASSVEAMYLELDLQPITSVRWGLAIQFFYYASSAEAPTLVRAALRDNMSLESKANAMLPSWFAHLVGVAAVCGIEIARWLPENGIERKDLPSPAETKGIVRRWQRGALEAKMSKARAFFLRPILSPKIRDYLQILSFEERFHFTRMRMGFTYLQIELGRWQTVKPSSKERTCRMCPLSITEDVPHVLGGCGNEKLHKLRMEFMAQLLSLPKAEFYAAFADWSSPVLWWLLLNETEPQVLRCVAKYGKTALSLVYTYPLTL